MAELRSRDMCDQVLRAIELMLHTEWFDFALTINAIFSGEDYDDTYLSLLFHCWY